jgi:dolichol-phosphate mannosyltransferase
MRLLVIIPTYNEIENIQAIIREVFNSLSDEECDILVVDDNSPDKTADAVMVLQEEYKDNLFLLLRQNKKGFASAYIDGYSWGIERNYDCFLEMDADFSHDPKYIKTMLENINNYDFVIGSRNIRGGRIEGWPFWRHILSKGGSFYSRFILGCRIKDLTGGFNMWRKETIVGVELDKFISEGYSFLLEKKYRAYKKGYKYVEIPITFKDRAFGKSKMSKKIFFEALINVWKIKKSKI